MIRHSSKVVSALAGIGIAFSTSGTLACGYGGPLETVSKAIPEQLPSGGKWTHVKTASGEFDWLFTFNSNPGISSENPNAPVPLQFFIKNHSKKNAEWNGVAVVDFWGDPAVHINGLLLTQKNKGIQAPPDYREKCWTPSPTVTNLPSAQYPEYYTIAAQGINEVVRTFPKFKTYGFDKLRVFASVEEANQYKAQISNAPQSRQEQPLNIRPPAARPTQPTAKASSQKTPR